MPVRYVLATSGNLGADDEEMEAVGASLDPIPARNPNLKVSAKVTSNHSHILRKDFKAVAQAVRETAATSTSQRQPLPARGLAEPTGETITGHAPRPSASSISPLRARTSAKG